MMRLLGALFLVAAIVVPVPTAGAAETVRLAVLVGNNVGTGARRPLRYAEADAHKLGEVLSELGGFNQNNVHVINGRGFTEVASRLEQLKAQVVGWRSTGRRVVLLFYFSGHSDGEALELGRDRWSYRDLRERLKELGADIRIVIVDSCQSGALLGKKGGTPGPTFDMRFSNDLATAGEAVLTSSTADELALESRDIRASFFSHHLVSGLRGAADASGDGRVTLAEAYKHAFVNTLLATAGTLTGPQHPGYDYQMTGHGEFVLTEVVARGATLTLPGGFDQILIVDEKRTHLVAELTPRSANRVALPAGHYILRGRRTGRAYELRVKLGQSEARSIARDEFQPAVDAIATAKGEAWESTAQVAAAAPGFPDRAVLITLEAGALRGAAEALPWLGSLKLTARSPRRFGGMAGVELGTGQSVGFRESTARAIFGAFAGSTWGRWRGDAGWRLVGGATVQHLEAGGSFWTWSAGTGLWLGASFTVVDPIVMLVTAGVDGLLLRRDGERQLLFSPNASIGLAVAF